MSSVNDTTCPHCGCDKFITRTLSAGFIHVSENQFECGYIVTNGVETGKCKGQKQEPEGCTCSIQDLMVMGCRCGQIQKEKQ